MYQHFANLIGSQMHVDGSTCPVRMNDIVCFIGKHSRVHMRIYECSTYKSNGTGWRPIAPAAVERDHSVVDKHATHVHVSAWSK